ncbi:MAG: short-chain dehydrogenase [Microbacteriaceae bacterium]|nr:short-chain dehydrogenase [Microbacteriaceae bacterium]
MTSPRVDLAGRVAVVTGGAAGIGLGISRSLALAGARVLILDIDRDGGERAVAELGATTESVVVDARDGDGLGEAIASGARRLGQLDILVNNVGGVRRRPLLHQSLSSMRNHINLNLMSVLAATSAAAPLMVASGRGGSIINVSSIEAGRAAPGFAVYAACKAAMDSLTRSMAVEFAEHGIRVNGIAPDHTATPGARGQRGGEARALISGESAAMASLVPLGREGAPDECGMLAAFLASDLSSYLTGTVIPIDGGTSAAGGWHRSPSGEWQLVEGYRFSEPAG